MPDLLLSDVHIRLDRPDRGERLARVVDRAGKGDTIYVVGDLCDFWFASRQLRNDPLTCPGLRSLAAFTGRGGRLVILAGNHDLWLGPFYRETLGAEWVPGPLDLISHGYRLRLAHGHRFGTRSVWKAMMESHAFLRAFEALPARVAEFLESRLERSNDAHRAVDDREHIEIYRRYVDQVADPVDTFVLGHIHQTIDESRPRSRMIVIGSWHKQSSYVIIDDRGPRLVVEADPPVTPVL